MDELQIINGLQAGGIAVRQYEDHLYTKFAYFIREGCQKYHLSEEDSFTAYSDAVIATIHNIRTQRFEGRSTIKTYIFQVFSNKCVDLVRKNTTDKTSVHRSLPIDMLSHLPDNVKNIVEVMMQKFNRTRIQETLKTLGDKCREILFLFEEGFSDKEIAAQLSYQTAAVAKTSRLRCLDKLREKIKQMVS